MRRHRFNKAEPVDLFREAADHHVPRTEGAGKVARVSSTLGLAPSSSPRHPSGTTPSCRALLDPSRLPKSAVNRSHTGRSVRALSNLAHHWLRFGRLVLQDGAWNREQILPAGNQRLYIIPSEDMVMVRFGRQDATWSDAEFLSRVLQ